MVYPVIAPVELTSNVSSGSGTDHVASLRIRTVPPGPITRLPLALKKSSGRSAPYTRS